MKDLTAEDEELCELVTPLWRELEAAFEAFDWGRVAALGARIRTTIWRYQVLAAGR
jgi:hypothetical protein